jgi:hypothetical protein
LPDEVVIAGRDEFGIAAAGFDGELFRNGKTALQVNLKGDTECVEAGSEIGAGAGYANSMDGGQSVIIHPGGRIFVTAADNSATMF